MSLSSTERLISTSFSQKQVQATDASDDSLCPAEVFTFSPVLLYFSELSDHTMLKGMKGYQLTHSDLEFIRTLQEDKLIQKLQV